MIGIWFTAVYASHHYILDVMAGIICATIGINLFNYLIAHVKFLQKFIDRYEAIIE
jgi:membrane-associated phospholipid phosphatase